MNLYGIYILLSVISLSAVAEYYKYIPQRCTVLSPCVCKDERNNYVDLRPLALKNGKSRFTDTATPGSDDGLYSWNPCYPFTEGSNNTDCKDVAACKTNSEKRTFTNLGYQDTAYFSHFDNGNLSLNYNSTSSTTLVSLYCDLDVEVAFRCPGEMDTDVYWLQLRSKYACPTDKLWTDEQYTELTTLQEQHDSDVTLFSTQVPPKITTEKHPPIAKRSTPPSLHIVTTASKPNPDPDWSSQQVPKMTTPDEPEKSTPNIPEGSTPAQPHNVTVTEKPIPEWTTPATPHAVTMTSKPVPDVSLKTISFLLLCILMVTVLILGVLVAGGTYVVSKRPRRSPPAYHKLAELKSPI